MSPYEINKTAAVRDCLQKDGPLKLATMSAAGRIAITVTLICAASFAVVHVIRGAKRASATAEHSLAAPAAQHVQQAATAAEQDDFSEDTGVKNPVPLPADVANLLLESDEAKRALGNAADTARRDPSQLFEAAEVHLGRADERDLVVIGQSPLSGADTGWFWIVRSADKNPKILLFATGLSLSILDTRTNGLRDVGTAWSSANEEVSQAIYSFDGAKYKEVEEPAGKH